MPIGRHRPPTAACHRRPREGGCAAMHTHGPQPVSRQLPTEEARDLLALTRDLAQREIAPSAAAEEEAGRFPRETFTLIGEAGLLGLPYSEEYGGGGQPYEVYLQ